MKSLNETPNIQQNSGSINEMVKINLKENGNKWWNLNYNVYDVIVMAENSPNKFAHCHIKHKGNGWDIRVLPDGTVHSIKTKGKGMQNQDDMKKFEKITKEWVKHLNVVDQTVTNGSLINTIWIMNN